MDSIQLASLKVNLTRLNERGIRDLFCLMCRLKAAYLGVRLQGVWVGSSGPIHLTFVVRVRVWAWVWVSKDFLYTIPLHRACHERSGQ